MRKPEQIQVPKDFYISERDRFYTDWSSSFWRELFQNSIDAGSSEISIEIRDDAGKGSFGRAPLIDQVIRIAFDDDGIGMDESVLRDVYFRPGETTKRDGSTTGGYGRARLMTCFSQVRYAIRTQDMVVEGDGPEFTCMSLEDAIQEKQAAIGRAETAVELERLSDDLRALKGEPGWRQGCKLEIDVNPNEYPDRPWRNASSAKLMDSLHSYLSQAQLYVDGTNKPLVITVNGEEWTKRLRKGKAIRNLVVEMEDGREIPMATVHVNKSTDAPWRNAVLFRIDGAPMLKRDISNDVQVIIELNKQYSREFLTSNRDGFKPRYESVINEFLEDILVDHRSALQDRDEISHKVFEGDHGSIEVFADVTMDKPLSEEDVSNHISSQTRSFLDEVDRSYRTLTLQDLNDHVGQDVLGEFTKLVRGGGQNFLDGYDDAFTKNFFLEKARDSSFEEAFEDAPHSLREFILKQLTARTALQERGLKNSLHDIHVRSENPTPSIRKAMRRYNPSNWDVQTGYGGDAMALQAAWQVCCKHAVKTLMRVAPNDPAMSDGRLEFETGWFFKPAEQQYLGDRYQSYRTEALHTKKDDTHVLLLNPVTDEGKRAYKLSDPEDIQKLMTLAVHEAVHICSRRHDEYWAELMTKVVSAFDFQRSGKVSQEVKQAVARTREIFRSGKAVVQEADPTPPGEQRPWERLAAISAPTAAMTGGLLAAPENRGALEQSALTALYGSCFARNPATGSMIVDCDGMTEIDDQLIRGIAAHNEKRKSPEAERIEPLTP